MFGQEILPYGSRWRGSRRAFDGSMGVDLTEDRNSGSMIAVRAFSRALHAAAGAARRFASETRGGIAPFIAVAIIPLVAFIGIGTDTARGYIVKSRLGHALDSAGLAGGRVMYSATRDDDIRMYFAANFPPGYMNATVDGPHFVVSPDNEKITLVADATIGTTFMRVLGINTLTVHASTEVTRETIMMDVVLSMDVSGSMGQSVSGVQKIAAARDAATTLVNILFGANATNDLLHIGIVPWNSKVNVSTTGQTYTNTWTQVCSGPNFVNPLTGSATNCLWYSSNSELPMLKKPGSTSTETATWKGCVYARYLNDGDSTDDADELEGQITVGGKGWMGWEPIVTSEGEPTASGSTHCSSAPNNSNECTPCYSVGITPLINDKQTLLDRIAQLTNPTGNTNLPQGLDMAWQVLTPAQPYSEAVANPPGRRRQVIIIMTDGDNMGGYGDAYKAAFGTGAAAQGNMTTNKRLNYRFAQTADNIKATGVEIYAIQFGDPPTATQAALMQNAATQINGQHYFYAPDAATLNSVFQQIANNLSELRLSK